MSSFYENFIRVQSLENEISKINNVLYEKDLLQRKWQSNCQHLIVIHYGDEKLSEMYQQNYYIGNFYCPCCGQRNLRIERSTKDNEGKAFIIEASGYKSSNARINLQEVLKIYKIFAKKIYKEEEFSKENSDSAKKLVETIEKNSGIPFYKGIVTDW